MSFKEEAEKHLTDESKKYIMESILKREYIKNA